MSTLHLLLLLGSPFLGLEAVVMGLGGRALTSYRRHRNRTLLVITGSGLAVSCASLATGEMAGLPGLGTVCLLLLYLPLVAKLLSLLRPFPPSPPLPTDLPGREVEEWVRRRYGRLLEDRAPSAGKKGRRARGDRGGGP